MPWISRARAVAVAATAAAVASDELASKNLPEIGQLIQETLTLAQSNRSREPMPRFHLLPSVLSCTNMIRSSTLPRAPSSLFLPSLQELDQLEKCRSRQQRKRRWH